MKPVNLVERLTRKPVGAFGYVSSWRAWRRNPPTISVELLDVVGLLAHRRAERFRGQRRRGHRAPSPRPKLCRHEPTSR
jgi:hypothetical protein